MAGGVDGALLLRVSPSGADSQSWPPTRGGVLDATNTAHANGSGRSALAADTGDRPSRIDREAQAGDH
ncbi:MAG: hypothetical protein EA381_05445 [Planctomycetaceae bacterium]|nr:MAG: hypothetical protein EA381_05445 [Planctomycetaceae bacterium]